MRTFPPCTALLPTQGSAQSAYARPCPSPAEGQELPTTHPDVALCCLQRPAALLLLLPRLLRLLLLCGRQLLRQQYGGSDWGRDANSGLWQPAHSRICNAVGN